MSDYKPKVGDRVRLVFEGTYTSVGPGVNVGRGVYFYEDHAMAAAKSIEKIEPPVVTFKPGDVVRYVGDECSQSILALGEEGFLNLRTGSFHEYGAINHGSSDNGGRFVGRKQITSPDYEKIDL